MTPTQASNFENFKLLGPFVRRLVFNVNPTKPMPLPAVEGVGEEIPVTPMVDAEIMTVAQAIKSTADIMVKSGDVARFSFEALVGGIICVDARIDRLWEKEEEPTPEDFEDLRGLAITIFRSIPHSFLNVLPWTSMHGTVLPCDEWPKALCVSINASLVASRPPFVEPDQRLHAEPLGHA